MSERFSLKDHLFNPQTVAQLGAEYAPAVSGFDRERFQFEALSGFESRELMARMDWLADCIEAQISSDFNAMADQLEAAMPPALSLDNTDDDFGHFIHAVPGILAARHGLENHRERAMALLYQGTQRFSMEFYIRAFLNRWPDETLAELAQWADDPNYHVRRLVSEGTRPKLPWAKAVSLTPAQTMPFLDQLHADPTRYVTRSVANHLNDLSKIVPDLVVAKLAAWKRKGQQTEKELDWMTRHALRSLVKQGHAGALSLLGYRSDADLHVTITIPKATVAIGDSLQFDCTISATQNLPVLIDYRIDFARPQGRRAEKVFKLKQAKVSAAKPLVVSKTHKLKADATTFTWYPGTHHVTIQVNGMDHATATFEVS